MFFSSKNTDSGVERYKQEIEELKKELAFYKEIAGFSVDEGLYVISERGEILFENGECAEFPSKLHKFKSDLFAGTKVIEDETCEAVVKTKRLSDGTLAVALSRKDNNLKNDDELISMHQQSIKNALSSTQKAFADMLAKFEVMIEQSKDTAESSMYGMDILKTIVSGMDEFGVVRSMLILAKELNLISSNDFDELVLISEEISKNYCRPN